MNVPTIAKRCANKELCEHITQILVKRGVVATSQYDYPPYRADACGVGAAQKQVITCRYNLLQDVRFQEIKLPVY